MNDLRHDPEARPKPSDAFANLREQFDAYFAATPDARTFMSEQRSGGEDAPDLRTIDERHDDEIAALRDNLEDVWVALHKQTQMVQILWLAHELRERTP